MGWGEERHAHPVKDGLTLVAPGVTIFRERFRQESVMVSQMRSRRFLMTNKPYVLRVEKRPYIVFAIIYGSPVFLFPIIIVANPDSLIGLSLAYALYLLVIALLFFSFWLYRIVLLDGEVIDRGLKATKRAPVSAINQLRVEVGWGGQRWLWAPILRPFRRLAIYYTVNDRKLYIDVSLSHFSLDNIRGFLNALSRLRPDLRIPNDLPK